MQWKICVAVIESPLKAQAKGAKDGARVDIVRDSVKPFHHKKKKPPS